MGFVTKATKLTTEKRNERNPNVLNPWGAKSWHSVSPSSGKKTCDFSLLLTKFFRGKLNGTGNIVSFQERLKVTGSIICTAEFQLSKETTD